VPQAHDGFIVVNLGIGRSPTALLYPPNPVILSEGRSPQPKEPATPPVPANRRPLSG